MRRLVETDRKSVFLDPATGILSKGACLISPQGMEGTYPGQMGMKPPKKGTLPGQNWEKQYPSFVEINLIKRVSSHRFSVPFTIA